MTSDGSSLESTPWITAFTGEYPENAVMVYTDGGAIGNPGPGGYGVVFETGETFSVGFNLTTNNRMELLSVIVAFDPDEPDIKVRQQIHGVKGRSVPRGHGLASDANLPPQNVKNIKRPCPDDGK